MKTESGLKKREDFSRVYRKGKQRAGKLLVLYSLPNGTGISRLGISVSKKVGNSVVRHRIKRLIRESWRLGLTEFKQGYDLVVIARNAAKGTTYGEIRSALLCLAKEAGLLAEKETPPAKENHDQKGNDPAHPDLSEIHFSV